MTFFSQWLKEFGFYFLVTKIEKIQKSFLFLLYFLKIIC